MSPDLKGADSYEIEFSTCGKVIASSTVTATNDIISYAIPQDITLMPIIESVIGIQVVGNDGENIIKSPIIEAYIGSSLQDSTSVASDAPVGIPAKVDQLMKAKHTHANKAVLDKFAEDSDGKPTYNGTAIGGGDGENNSSVNVKSLGAKGDGTTDDTEAFKTALAQHRCVYVPAGTYKLSDVLTIRDACRLELSTDTVLDFTQTSKNCIAMKMSAYLTGNHAVIKVPYGFNKNVIYVASSLDSSVTDVPPYKKWDPQWKTGRYITDICITKTDSRGFHYSVDGTCSGTAVYIEADGTATSTFIWGLNFSGIRIAGAFSFGIHAKMISSGWCHEARIEAVIDACETGVCLEDCNNAYISAAIQPRSALTTAGANVAYAKYGIQLIRSRNTDLSGSRVWDWNSNNTLWSGDTTSGCVYQHIAMTGNCSGTILNDFLYYEMPSYDIRKLIYTDTDSNLEKITILQEPFTRWFKPSSDDKPTFYNGSEYKELCLKETYDATFETVLVPNFVNKLPLATDVNGTAYGNNGYITGKQLSTDGSALIDNSGFITTGFIPVKEGDVIRLKGLSFTPGDNTCRLFIYDSSHSFKALIGRSNLQGNLSTAFVKDYAENDDGSCEFTMVYSGTAYIRLTLYKSSLTSNTPIVSVNQELTYSQVGALASGVKVNYAQLTNMPEFLTLATLPKYDGGVS